MLDILSAVYDFVLKYACDAGAGVPAYDETQIVRGWQNSATLPPTVNEFCIITELNTIAHGTTSELCKTDVECQYKRTVEHVIQIDFISSEGITAPHATLLRANVINMLCNTSVATSFFKSFSENLTCLYCDGVTNLSSLDETKTYATRYQVVIHLAEILSTSLTVDTFSNVKLNIENVDAHHHIN